LQISEGKDLETKILTLKQNIIMKTKTSIYHRTFAFAYRIGAIRCGGFSARKPNTKHQS
jgi:hypothetical protein